MKISLIIGLFISLQSIGSTDHLTVEHQGKTISSVSRTEYSLPFLAEPFIDQEKYKGFLEKLDQLVYQAPVNAFIDENGKIIPEKAGLKLNRTAITEQIYDYFFNKGPSRIEVPTISLYPKVDSELLSHIREKQIGHYITYFNPRNKNRTLNIILAAKAINNHVIFPGETFSFNGVVGKRTVEKGYLPAPIIVKGELSEGVGGGICQVSSTLFNAVDNAGIHILERYSHSKSVPYVPEGRDATVSWYGPDFIFENNYNQPILIRAHVYGGKVIVKVYSSDLINYKPRKVSPASGLLPMETMFMEGMKN
ncbi:putative factor for cell wall maintenance or synthesis [Bacillus methanolicus PB1]|uniref:Putative factor for cell wall maintenance or synthesis n=1 Tax=Bacillus methanolicus PB1 TaxID=997296 RepID=I3DV57_BACMT|nr:VanW family protein [Bacillus methanolicus]EIJ78128.1 putative factor for cell wall maintenance or synthesis [Bacillus methanolicus PB1]